MGLDALLPGESGGFRQIAPVFTNVIFDTSQPHANTISGTCSLARPLP
jgi:hypothetical protein